MDIKAILLGEKDNVATAIDDLNSGQGCLVNGKNLTTKIEIKGDIPFGHKIALENIKKGSKIIKYNEVIGIATNDIEKGQHVHTHNLSSIRGRGDLVSP